MSLDDDLLFDDEFEELSEKEEAELDDLADRSLDLPDEDDEEE